jgi:hypothetical protein
MGPRGAKPVKIRISLADVQELKDQTVNLGFSRAGSPRRNSRSGEVSEGLETVRTAGEDAGATILAPFEKSRLRPRRKTLCKSVRPVHSIPGTRRF